ncbi:hypothetical protein C1646_755090 [Rhizophagus diaphanus]|nr:hypothetical protein C1646_755090 [Rhizophagus diaphanus] [Rhizophagus sp. MUCL 43196]
MLDACKKAGIQTLNKAYQSDTTPMPHDKVGNRIYKYRGVIKDVATRFIIDRGTEYMSECKDLLLSYNIKIQYTNSKHGVAIAERDHQEFEKHAYFWQDAEDFHLPLTDRSRAWVKGLRINDDIYNDTPTQLIGMSSNEAVKRALKGKKIIARTSVKHRRPIGYNEPLLPSYTEVRYLLEPSKLEVIEEEQPIAIGPPKFLQLILI